MTTAPIIQLSSDFSHVDNCLVGIMHIHALCVEHDKTTATFLPPLSETKLLPYWRECLDEIATGYRRIWVELQPISSRTHQLKSPLDESRQKPIRIESDPDTEYEVAGVVALAKTRGETGAFRAEVHKLLVSPNHRQKGIARRLMTVLERTALADGRTCIILDTEIGSAAEHVYPRFGYIEFGKIFGNGISPIPGKLYDAIFFYKDLNKGTL